MNIAVLIATYNGAKYIEDLLVSLSKQSYKDFVCYIHDDGSTDATIDIISDFSKKGLLNIRMLNYPSTGSAKNNFFSMLKHVKEPYVMFCDQDDVWKDNKIEKTFKRMKDVEIKDLPTLVFTDLEIVDENLGLIHKSFMEYTGRDPNRVKLEQLLLENIAPGCTMMINEALYKQAEVLTSYDNVVMHDYWFMLVASCVGRISFVEESLILYRQHGNNTVGASKKTSIFHKFQTMISLYITKENIKKVYEQEIKLLQMQAGSLLSIDSMRKQDKVTCEAFCNLSNNNKIDRMLFYIRKHMLGGHYKWWFLIWC